MPILTTSYFENYQPLADLVLPNLQAYCDRHGYGLRTQISDDTRSYGFQKIEQMRDALPHTDMVLCCDIDILITNFNYKIEDFTDPEHDAYFVIDRCGLNSGVSIWCNRPAAYEYIDAVMATEKLGCPHEQAAITGMVRDWKRSKFLHHPSINSYLYREYGENRPQSEGQWFKGDFLLHLPGLPLSRRLAITARKLANDVITEDQTQL